MDTKQKFELLRAVNLLMQACAKLEAQTRENDHYEILFQARLVRVALSDAAPLPFEVAKELRAMCRAEIGTWCITPKGFSLGEGLLMEARSECITIEGKPVMIDALRDAVEALGESTAMPSVLYFGPYTAVGHHLRGPDGLMVRADHLSGLGFIGENLRQGNNFGLALDKALDGGYTPSEDRNRPQVEGHARLTHEHGMTVLGIWDRSIDKRGGSHSTYIAVGTFDFATMCKLCQMVYPMRWALLASRVEIKLVQAENIGAAGTGQ